MYRITNPARSLPHACTHCPTVETIKSMQTFETFNLGKKINHSTQLRYLNLFCLLFPLVDRDNLRPQEKNFIEMFKPSLPELLLTVQLQDLFSDASPSQDFSLGESIRKCCCLLRPSVTYWRQKSHPSFLNLGSRRSALISNSSHQAPDSLSCSLDPPWFDGITSDCSGYPRVSGLSSP